MKALTICQPYAELIARGEKIIENRTRWPSTYRRGPLLIHAGKSREWFDFSELSEDETLRSDFGAIIAQATLVDVLPWDQLSTELQQHHHANGPMCLVLENVRRFERPIPYRGLQGLFDIPNDCVAAALRASSADTETKK